MKYVLAPVCKAQALVFRASSNTVNGRPAKELAKENDLKKEAVRTEINLTAIVVKFSGCTPPFLPTA